MPSGNPCLSCGACCSHFRVSFYWSEAEPTLGGTVPPEYIQQISPLISCMKGTNQARPRCSALIGEVGKTTSCSIYEYRPSTCREFGISIGLGGLYYAPGELERCNHARATWGLPPLKGYYFPHKVRKKRVVKHFHHLFPKRRRGGQNSSSGETPFHGAGV